VYRLVLCSAPVVLPFILARAVGMQSKPRKRGEEANGEAGEDVLLGSFLWEEVIQRAQLQRSPEDVSACDVGACVVGGRVGICVCVPPPKPRNLTCSSLTIMLCCRCKPST
jgi:hypothetical protein